MKKIETSDFEKIFTPKNMIYLGIFMILIAVVETPFYGYANIANYYFKLLEEPMDLVAFGVNLIGIGIITHLFWKRYQKFGTRLGLFTLFMTLSVRTFWEVNWVTGAYMSSVYVWYSLTNNVSPVYQSSLWNKTPGSAWPTLDYITNNPYHMNFILPIFGISTAAVIMLMLSMIFDWRTLKK